MPPPSLSGALYAACTEPAFGPSPPFGNDRLSGRVPRTRYRGPVRAALLVSAHDIVGRSDQGAGAAEPLVAPEKKRLSACGRTFRFFPVATP